jgi:hypothetical protein
VKRRSVVNLIKLEQTQKHYLLSIPQSIKMRAKKIAPRQWDPARAVWVYPRNELTYESLINEFKGDLGVVQITPPTQSNNKNAEVAHQQVLKLKKKILSMENSKAEMETEIEDYISIIGGLNNEVEKLNNKKGPAINIERDIKRIAKKSAGDNPSFNKVIDDLEFDSSLPVEIQKPIISCLRRKLNVSDEMVDFFSLITKGKEEGLISLEACDYLHTVRKQRNSFAHNIVDSKTRMARVLFVITAASLAWAHLDCDSKK